MPRQRRPKSEFQHIATLNGHTLQFEFAPSVRQPKELYAVWDDRRIAYRGKPGTPQAGKWVSMVPGYEVVDEGYPDRIAVFVNGKVVYYPTAARGGSAT